MSQGYPQNEPPKSGGMSTLTIVLIVLGVLFLGCAGICAGCMYTAGRIAQEGGRALTEAIELASANDTARRYIEADEAVTMKYGDSPMTGIPSREGDATKPLDVNDTHFTVSVEGNGAKGTAHVRAQQVTPGQWKILELKITNEDGTTTEVDVSGEPPPPELDFNVGDGDGTEMPADPTTPPGGETPPPPSP